MSERGPTCNAPLPVDDVMRVDPAGFIAANGKVVHLTRNEMSLLDILMSKSPHFATTEQIHHAMKRAVRRYGDQATTEALRAIRATWPDEPKAMRGTMITALARILRINRGRLGRDRLRQAMHRLSVPHLTAEAEAHRKLAGGSAELALSKTIADACNKAGGDPVYYAE